jgi:NAD(P)-dependent dehydrogenase (short-subunit alcohol dehydrogenase family)
VGRDKSRLDAALDRVRAAASAPVSAHRCDFAVLHEVRALAATLREQHPRIDVLANNAGGTISSRQSTVDGHELTIQSNYLAPFLLSHELREQVRGGRIINTSSDAHRAGRIDPDNLNGAGVRYLQLAFYGSAKQANILFAAEAARRWPDILSTSYHPGIVRTRFGRDSALFEIFYRAAPFLRTPAKGAETLVWLAETQRAAIANGGFYVDKRLRRPTRRAADPDLAARIWDASLTATLPH